MKLLYFRLKGYGPIYNGMNLDEIEIPFADFKNKIILIQGDNGLGKSTILNTLSFEPDGSTFYREGYTAEKEIHATDGNNIYVGKIISPVNGNGNRSATRAYLSKNGEELNPTGNVSSYKEAFSTEFNIDQVFIQLSIISSDNRGLVEKTPSDRKKYIAPMISSTEFYNDAYKNLSKKASVFKSHINTITNKIYSIGDESNLRTTSTSLNLRLHSLKNEREKISKIISKEEAVIQILDPDSKIQDIYQRIYDELNDVNFNLRNIEVKLDKIHTKHNLECEDERSVEILLNEYTTDMNKLVNINNMKQSELQNKTREIEAIIKSIDIKQSKLDSLQSDANYINIIDNVEELRNKIQEYEKNYIGINNMDMSRDEIVHIVNLIKKIKEMIVDSKRDYDSNLYETVVDIIISGGKINSHEVTDEYNNNIRELNNLKNKYSLLSTNLKSIEILSNRPDNCNIDNCYFIKQAIELKNNNIDKQLLDIENEINKKEDYITQLNKKMETINTMDCIYQYIINILNTIDSSRLLLSKLKCSDVLLDFTDLLIKMKSGYSFNDLNESDKYITYADIINDYKSSKNILISLEADLKVYQSQLLIVEELTNDINELTQSMSDLNIEIQNLNKDISFNNSLISKFNEKINICNSIIEIEKERDILLSKKANIREEFQKIKDNIKQIKESVDKINDNKNKLITIDSEIEPISSQIDGINYSIATLVSYNSELEMYKDKYEKIEFLKECCSPSKGIQTLFMNVYMNKTMQLANELLSHFFNGELTLLKPIINSDEFRIPFVGSSGIPVNDISYGSTAQRSMIAMILSSVLAIQGSDKYNIMRLDEIDGGLDSYNKMMFTQVLYMIINILNIDQCILISHSIEIETHNVDLIRLTKYGLKFGNET